MSSDTKYSTGSHPRPLKAGDRAVDARQDDDPEVIIVEKTDVRADDLLAVSGGPAL